MRADAVRNFLREQTELREGETAARHEFAEVPADVRERAEPVVFQFEQPVRMIEGFRDRNERHRPVLHGQSVSRQQAGVASSIARFPGTFYGVFTRKIHSGMGQIVLALSDDAFGRLRTNAGRAPAGGRCRRNRVEGQTVAGATAKLAAGLRLTCCLCR